MERGTLPPGARADLNTAITLTLVALILEAVFLAVGVLVLLVFLPVISVTSSASVFGAHEAIAPLQIGDFSIPIFFGFFVGFLVAAGIFAVVFLLLTYFLVYKPLKDEQVERALTPALVLGIIVLVFGGVIVGILLIVGYVKAKDAHTKILLAPAS